MYTFKKYENSTKNSPYSEVNVMGYGYGSIKCRNSEIYMMCVGHANVNSEIKFKINAVK